MDEKESGIDYLEIILDREPGALGSGLEYFGVGVG